MDRAPDDVDDWVTISSIEHWSYCPRQYALIDLEDSYADDRRTAAGTIAHEHADDPGYVTQRGVRLVRGMKLVSNFHRLSGRADFVEFHGDRPFPVEMKSGSFRTWPHEALQLAAQALCLEEMSGQQVPFGAIYYKASRRRRTIDISDELRAQVLDTAASIRRSWSELHLPPAVNDHRCPPCSLESACMPAVLSRPARIRSFYAELFHPSCGE